MDRRQGTRFVCDQPLYTRTEHINGFQGTEQRGHVIDLAEEVVRL